MLTDHQVIQPESSCPGSELCADDWDGDGGDGDADRD